MSKTSETKNKILELLKGGNKRLIDIYPVLGLSPATVSQHLKELKELNLINEIDNSHFKNEKYYSINKDYAENNYVANKSRNKTLEKLGLGIVGIVIVAAALAFFLIHPTTTSQSGQQSSTLSILLTDPPHVPLGTTSLNITYSAIQLHLADSSPSSWITLNSTGKLDLMSLINVSKLIGTAQLPTNAIVDMVSLNITNAEIGIGNQSYAVSLSSKRVVGQVFNNRSFNSSSALLVDFSPTVITLYNENSTLFEMVPSVTAVMVDKGHFLQQPGGNPQQFMLDANTSRGLRELFAGINVTKSSITQSGNYTQISITVKDTSNDTIDIQHVLIFGNESLYLNPVPMPIAIGSGQFPGEQGDTQGGFPYRNGTNGTYGRNRSQGGRRFNFSNANFTNQMPSMPPNGMGYRVMQGGPGMIMNINFTNAYNLTSGKINSSWGNVAGVPPPMPNGQWMEVGGFLNVPMKMKINSSSAHGIEESVSQAYMIGLSKQSLGVISLNVNRNATLSISGFPTQYPPSMQGYVISPGESVTLTFNGTLSLGGNLLKANFTSGTKYSIDVIGSDSAYAESNVIAG